MTENAHPPAASDLTERSKGWWEVPVPNADANGNDAEIRALDRMAANLGAIPEWALQVREAMPKWGFEMCAHRWLEGLDDVLGMIGGEAYWPSTAGHCGEIPGQVVDTAERHAAAVQGWIDEQAPGDALGKQVQAWLGARTPAKVEAAQCYVHLLRAFLFERLDHPAQEALIGEWAARGAENPVLAQLLAEYTFGDTLQNACGYKLVERLDLNIRVIGGDTESTGDRLGNCNSQLRFMWRDDPARYEVTRGYLWGLQADLLGRDEAWLRATVPDCAGAAIHALQRVSQAGPARPVHRWLAASLLKTTALWCQRVLSRWAQSAPPSAAVLPHLMEAIAH